MKTEISKMVCTEAKSKSQKSNIFSLKSQLMVLLFVLSGISIFAQPNHIEHRGHPTNKMEQFTPEQHAQLMLKKLTLELDLNDLQQKEFKIIIAERQTKRESFKSQMKKMSEVGKFPSKDEQFENKMKMLDDQIIEKKKIEKILTPKQFEKWSLLKEEYHEKQKKVMQKKHKRQGKC